MGTCCSPPVGSVRTTVALTLSCPSRKTVALTSNGSPTTDLAGNAPCSMQGATRKTGMRLRVSGAAGWRLGARVGTGCSWLAVIGSRLPGASLGAATRWGFSRWRTTSTMSVLARSQQVVQELARHNPTSPMLLSCEGYSSIQRPYCPARADQRLGRARHQSALVLAPRHPGPILRDRPEALGQGSEGTRQDAVRAVCRRASAPGLGRGLRDQSPRGG